MKSRSVGLILSYINTFLSMITGLFLSAFYIARLGDTEYGVYQTIASFANYLVLLEFGTGTVMSRNISICRAKNASKEEIEKNVSTIWSITNILSLIILLVSVIFYLCIGSIYVNSLTAQQIASGKNMFIFITVYLLASFYSQTLNGITLAYEDYTYSSKLSIIKTVSRTALLVILLLNFNQAIFIAIVDATINIIIATVTYIYCKKKFNIKINLKNFDKVIFKSSIPLCLALFLQAIMNQANNNVDKFIIGVVLNPETVTLYSVALYIYSIFSSLTTIPISMYGPQVTRDVVSGIRGKDLTDKLVQPNRLIVLIGGTILGGFFAVGRQFISIVYGEEYLLAWIIALILMVPMFINMTTAIALNVLDAMNKRLARSFALFFTTILNIVLTIFFLQWYGVVGAAVATAISLILGNVIIMDIYYSRSIGLKIMYMYYKTYKGIVIYQLLGAGIAYFVGTLIANVWLSFVVGGVLFLVISFSGFLLFGKSVAEKEMINKFVNKLTRKNKKENEV